MTDFTYLSSNCIAEMSSSSTRLTSLLSNVPYFTGHKAQGLLSAYLVGSHHEVLITGKARSIPDATGAVVHVQAQAAVQLGLGLVQPLPHQRHRAHYQRCPAQHDTASTPRTSADSMQPSLHWPHMGPDAQMSDACRKRHSRCCGCAVLQLGLPEGKKYDRLRSSHTCSQSAAWCMGSHGARCPTRLRKAQGCLGRAPAPPPFCRSPASIVACFLPSSGFPKSDC